MPTPEDQLPHSVNGERRAVTLDDLALVDIGTTVYALDLNEDTDVNAAQVKGGTVIAIETGLDEASGEYVRRFVTAKPWGGRTVYFDTLLASDVRQVAMPNGAVIKSLIRCMGLVVAGSKQMSSDQVKCVGAMNRLMEVL